MRLLLLLLYLYLTNSKDNLGRVLGRRDPYSELKGSDVVLSTSTQCSSFSPPSPPIFLLAAVSTPHPLHPLSTDRPRPKPPLRSGSLPHDQIRSPPKPLHISPASNKTPCPCALPKQ